MSAANSAAEVTARARGFALLEVLIAIVIVGIGLLGLAGLQVTGLSHNHDAYLRSQATLQAYDIADRMRANLGGVAGGHYDAGAAQSRPQCAQITGCDPQAMAEHDLHQWNLSNAELLPQGAGVVCLDSTPLDGDLAAPGCDGSGAVYAIKIWWTDGGRDGADKSTKRFVTELIP